jgi:hypothetical protein
MDLIIKVGIILIGEISNTKIIDLGQMKLNIKRWKTLNQETLNMGSTIYSVEWLHDRKLTNRKTHGRKQIWTNLRYNPSICLEGLRKTTRKLQSGELGPLPRFSLSTY